MDVLWAIIVILVILFVLFVVLPSILSSPTTVPEIPPMVDSTVTQPSLTPAQKQAVDSKAMLDTQYQEARSAVPENYPRKQIGDCPYSRAPSTDLPVANIPMCVAVQPQNMHLHTMI